MASITHRAIDLDLPTGKSAFLWGPRKTGKTYWLTHHFPKIPRIDLLQSDIFMEYSSRPALLRERYAARQGLVIIDEVQKVPALLDEIHWLMENTRASFLMTGSSARKLKRGHANLLGGRAWRRVMCPLTFDEVSGFDLEKVMVSGLLPPHFLSSDPVEDLRAYIADYLKEEIAAEALTKNIPAFSEFLRVAAVTTSELLDYTNMASECGVSAKVVRTYFDILEDTYLGFRIAPWKKSKNRRMILTEKFYLFDLGIVNYLCRRHPAPGTPEFGKSFEHFILMEIRAYQAYRNPEMDITFWRTSNGSEVDFILGDKEVAVEIKASPRVRDRDLVPLQQLSEDGPVGKNLVVSLEGQPRKVAGIEILPWEIFLKLLWGGDVIDS